MSKVYKHVSMARDEYLGRVTPQGRVYQARFGPDKRIGRVDLKTGKVFRSRLGPDKYIGRVELDTGRVFLAKFGPDQYLGRVNKDGKFYHHRRLARDDYLGHMTKMLSYGHGAAAFLLLVYPAYQEAELDTLPLEGEPETE
jgi:hypothetical protein